jgi:hypothetical protein
MKDYKETTDGMDGLLGAIEKIEVSPFMLTRIHAELEAQRQEKLPLTWAWAGTAVLALLLCLNVWTIQEQLNESLDVSIVVEEMNLIPENSLYN